MIYLFRVCFLTGSLFTVVSFLLGQLFDLAGFDGDLGLGGEVPGLTISPLKPVVIVSFVAVFGGAGLMATEMGLLPVAALAVAAGAGGLVAYAMYRFVVIPLYKAQNTSSVSHQDLIGHTATISLRIKGNGFGSIAYVVNGNSYSAPARSFDGTDLERGAEVIIARLEGHVYYVKRRGKGTYGRSA